MPCVVLARLASAWRTASSNGLASSENSGSPACTTASSSTITSVTSPETRGATWTTWADTIPRDDDGAMRSDSAYSTTRTSSSTMTATATGLAGLRFGVCWGGLGTCALLRDVPAICLNSMGGSSWANHREQIINGQIISLTIVVSTPADRHHAAMESRVRTSVSVEPTTQNRRSGGRDFTTRNRPDCRHAGRRCRWRWADAGMTTILLTSVVTVNKPTPPAAGPMRLARKHLYHARIRRCDQRVGVTRQIVLERSSATIRAPRGSTVTPTGRPRVLPSLSRKPETKSIGGPAGRPFANGTKTTL